MSDTWRRGYKEVKNVIYNELGITKEEIVDIIKKIVKEEIQKVVVDNKKIIYESIKDVVHKEMILSVIEEKKYPSVRKNLWNYTVENKFKDYVTDIMKEEILDMLRKQFELKFEIGMKNE